MQGSTKKGYNKEISFLSFGLFCACCWHFHIVYQNTALGCHTWAIKLLNVFIILFNFSLFPWVNVYFILCVSFITFIIISHFCDFWYFHIILRIGWVILLSVCTRLHRTVYHRLLAASALKCSQCGRFSISKFSLNACVCVAGILPAALVCVISW